MVSFKPTLFALGAHSLVAHAAGVAAPVVKVPGIAPHDASQIVDHAFAGLAMKGLSWPNFTLPFSQNLYNALATRTGTDVIIRLGGTSTDNTIVDLNQEEAVILTDGMNEGLRSKSTLGRAWFDGFEKLKNVRFIIQFGFARNRGHNYGQAVNYVQHALDRMGGCDSGKLEAVELGNEPNLYERQTRRAPGYTVEDYAKEAATYMDVLQGNISCLKTGRKFQVWQKSSNIDHPEWSTENFMLQANGIIDFSKVKTVSQHFYATQDKSSLPATLLNHTFTVSRTADFFKKAMRTVKNKDKAIKFIIDEVGNADVDASEEQVAHLSRSLGSAVWTVDWMLYAMTLNITGVNMQQGSHMAFAEWVPSSLQGGWYGHVFVTDFIGNDTSNQLQVKELKTIRKQSGNPHLVGYAGFEHGNLAKVALLNLQRWGGKPEGPRPSAEVSLELTGVPDGTAATIRRLTGPNSIALSNITWAGLDWPRSKDGAETKVKDNTVTKKVRNGKLDVVVNATEAILVSW
ncbi:Fc.00g047980.m01.CDS01 [Cosmosporella sp. VM-42]